MNKIIIASLFSGVGFISLPSFATQDLSGFYLSGKVGGSAVHLANQSYSYKDLDYPQDNIKWSGGSNNDTVFGGGIAAGYNFYPQFSLPVRTELEFYARGNADTKYNLYKDDWSRGDLKNEVSVNTLMLNAYYDFRNDSAFTPWVSAGIGYARIHQKTTGISTWDYGYGYSGRESLSRSGSADNFAWSLGAGIRYDVTPDIALDLSYRYLDAGDSSVSYKDEWGDKYKSEVDVKSHDIMLGVTYNF
ncbi:outer membrane protein [Escherichia coli]|uniref:outer membrane protein n=3 Tax=Escherichia coli TaxID=562 RepID=UPI000CF0FE51|nr:outer membrane beta-barrel protein [Escherichia coli]EEY3944128.1 porin family protein [Escherichia coli]EFA6010823.1 porin family protein [Escherichia coli]EFJ2087215.1 porin family protein [Escherichia coli]EFO4008481.1 porin family protein [Escherichia coli]EGI3098758.1 porin family protein [Escherichia coli]